MSIENRMKKYLLGESKRTLNEASVTCKQLGPNFTRVTIDGKTLFFSYETLVAVDVGGTLYGTDEKYSRTTSKQMNTLNIDKRISQKELEELAAK